MSEPSVSPPPARERAGRYERSASGMVGAMVLCLLLIGGFVGFRALIRSNPDGTPTAIDYRSEVRDLQRAGTEVVYPRALPTGWIATQVDYRPGTPPGIGLSLLTDGEEYIGVQQDSRSVADLLTTYVDAHATGGDPVKIPGAITEDWTSWADDGGDHALATTYGGGSLLVFGSASESDLRTVVEALTTAKVRG